MNVNNSIEDNYHVSKPGLRLTHPTAYHLQQQRLQNKDIDPTLDHSQLFLAQHQQQHNESSPHLSDIDYAELTSPTSLHTDYMSYPPSDGPKMFHSVHHHHNRRSMDQDYLYDDHSIDSSLAFSTQMKRNGSDDGNLQHHHHHHHHSQQQSATTAPQDFVFYTPVSIDQRFKQFAVSAPVNINYNNTHPVPAPSSFNDDALSEGTMLSNTNLSYGKTHTEPHSLENHPDSLDNYEDDYAAQINLQAIMEKRRRRRESHNAGKVFYGCHFT
ncbi:unnamed protein product [Cunninghamella blakesleeana]